jgi:hypothetical protein
VTTPWSSRSGIADYSRHLLPYLREEAEVDVYVEVGREGEESSSEPLRSVADLKPRDYDQILYQLGNEGQHAFMLPLIRGLGGTVMLHDWVLFDLAMAAHPSLQRGGLRGLQRAFREGGREEAQTYLRNVRIPAEATRGKRFRLGWYSQESGGRWSSAQSELNPGTARAARLKVHVPGGRTLKVLQGGVLLGKWAEPEDLSIELEFQSDDSRVLQFEVGGAGPIRNRRSVSDERELGVFLRKVELLTEGNWHSMSLDEPGTHEPQGLSADRFELCLNRSVVRHADAFLVHSDWVGDQVLTSRNAATPIARVHHGVERRWDGQPSRQDACLQLNLPSAWESSFVLGTLGALQQHKRPAVMLDALVLLRERGVDARLLVVGESRPEEFDLVREQSRRGLEGHVHVTGWLPEPEAWGAMGAAHLCVNLRGPSTGGTSGGACQALSLAKPVVISELPEFAHLPACCVLRLPHGESEAENLAAMVLRLREDPAELARMERAARESVEHELHWSHAARRYLEVLRDFPRPRASRRSLLVRFMHATAREKAQIT